MSNKWTIFVILLFYTIIAIQCASLQKTEETDGKTTLQYVAILHRHGFRAPERTFPKDPYNDQSKYWPEGWGELLPEGKRELYKLGTTLQHRYKEFISEYSADAVRVNSSDLNRCHMSTASMLAGWFPPRGDQVWSKKLLWQPVPIHSVPLSQDRVIGLRAPCAKFDLEKEKIVKEMKANATKEENEIFSYLSQHMGELVDDFHQVEVYYATLLIEKRKGLKLPKWTKKVFPHKMREVAAKSITVYTWNKFMKRMYGGPIIKDIVEHFKLKSEGYRKSNKVLVYSGSDTTLVDVWRALQFKERILPDFGSTFIFELHKHQDNKHFVKFFFMNDTTIEEPHQLNIPNCQDPCYLDELQTATQYVRSVDWDKDCVV